MTKRTSTEQAIKDARATKEQLLFEADAKNRNVIAEYDAHHHRMLDRSGEVSAPRAAKARESYERVIRQTAESRGRASARRAARSQDR